VGFGITGMFLFFFFFLLFLTKEGYFLDLIYASIIVATRYTLILSQQLATSNDYQRKHNSKLNFTKFSNFRIHL